MLVVTGEHITQCTSVAHSCVFSLFLSLFVCLFFKWQLISTAHRNKQFGLFVGSVGVCAAYAQPHSCCENYR